jgi:hypothetical protein
VKTITSDSYRVSERVSLLYGDKFRATGGPYWQTSDGQKIALKSYGPYTFHRHCKRGSIEWIEALDKAGNFSVLHIAGRRAKVDASLVPRPYRITGKKRRQLTRLDNRKKAS